MNYCLNRGIQLRFHPQEEDFPLNKIGTLANRNPCLLFKGRITLDNEMYVYHNYRFYYKDNLGIGCCYMCPMSTCAGYHVHDTEGVTILYDECTARPVKVYFHAHGYGQGQWRNWQDCKKNDNGFLIVYVARNSHASYPNAGLHPRVLGLGNDITSDRGKRIAYAAFTYIEADTVELDDTEIVMSLKRLPTTSSTLFERFFLPFTEKRLLKK